jgi:non-ribosomal peptide synthetase component E (peptide arylation enzyme)
LTQERWRDGWFRTGDIGRLDEHGDLVILGRTRDVIIRGGENITPGEIEPLLRTHPAVAQLAVVPVPDSLLGERVCACVVPAPGPPPTLEMLREHLRAKGVAHYKLPDCLIILSTLPMVGDKIDRLGLAARAAAEASGTLERAGGRS